MRWEDLRRGPAGAEAAGQLPLGLPEPAPAGTGRAGLPLPGPEPIQAGTDEAMAIEVQAKSIINRVPGESRMPFRWTVNPYRGCAHACVYCLAGDTPVLMADGRTRPLSRVRVGDEIYGTMRGHGGYRRYVTTRVLAHWSTVKAAYRVLLSDGTELVASGDHRFLTERGWKHVTGRMQGLGQRPYLTTGNRMIGTGGFTAPPEDTPDYRRGYLCGLLRGGAAGRAGLGWPPGRRIRLAGTDPEALRRVRGYLAAFDVAESPEPSAAVADAALSAVPEPASVGVLAAGGGRAVADLVGWPKSANLAWCKGFLAGVYDAAGSYPRGILRIASVDREITGWALRALDRLGFDAVLEDRGADRALPSIRVRGGLPEQLRFFHGTDPAITRKRTIDGRATKSGARLHVVEIRPLGADIPMYDITTGTGDFIANGVVSHNCFARNTHTYLDLDAGHDFDTKIVVKVNAGGLLRRELAAGRAHGEPIAMGTNVDCYQRAEGRYRLMREILSALADHANPYSILTKGTLIQRDLDLIQRGAAVADVSIAFSVGLLDEELWRTVEPGTPKPSARLDVVRRFADAGIACSVLMAPILPGLSDGAEQIDRTVAAIAAAGARGVTPIVLHLRPGAREWYRSWLTREHPHLLGLYRELYRRGSYAPDGYQRTVQARVRRAARRAGLAGPAEPGEHRETPRFDPPDQRERPERPDPVDLSDTGHQTDLLSDRPM